MPPALQALSPVSLSMQAVVWLVANCPTYQEVESVRNAGEAHETIHWPEETVDSRPRAIVAHTGEWDEERRGSGQWRNEGSYDVSFEFVIPEPYRGRKRDSQLWFDNMFGLILLEMRERSGTTDSQGRPLFNMHKHTRIAGPTEGEGSVPVDADYWFGVTHRVRWPN